MPQTDVYFYQESPGDVPVLDWLNDLTRVDRRAADKCRKVIERLETRGHELRRPHADLLRDGVYELRVRAGRVNYRLLYFFHGRGIALLAHALSKEKAVPVAEIDLALARKQRYEASPIVHRWKE